ncbi:MAG: fimbrillin family protein [Prevotella sp.]
MNHTLRLALSLITLATFTACSDDITSSIDNLINGKEPIAFAGEGSALTRAALTRAGFTSNTKLVIRIKAEDSTTGSTNKNRFTQAVATAGKTQTSDEHTTWGVGDHSDVTYVSGQTRYWDDAFGRTSLLTVYGVAIPNKNDASVLADNVLDQSNTTQIDANTNPNWYTVGTENTKIKWTVPTAQTSENQANRDLTFSNNIREKEKVDKGRYVQKYSNDSWTKSMELGRMQWEPKTQETGETSGKFDMGNLVFRHALSWLTINLKEGAGFDNNKNTDFTWTKEQKAATQNITLTGFNTEGELDLSNGNWTSQTTASIESLYENSGSVENKTTRTLQAYVIPGTNLYTTESNVIAFEIDNARYYVTGKQIAEAIRTYYDTGDGKTSDSASVYKNFTTLQRGKNYIINLTVAKKGISNVTAAILDWEKVESADAEAKNTYATFGFTDKGTKLVEADASKFSIYRAAKTATDYITASTSANYEWTTGYDTTPATKEWNSTSNSWSTNWFWENNLTYYHFRAIGDYGGSTLSNPITTAEAGDNFSIKSGALSGSDYKDYLWGAPFAKTDNKVVYTDNYGFNGNSADTHQISPAISATDSQIKMMLFHATSQITVNVRTTTGNDKVVLQSTNGETTNNTKVEILNFLPTGTVLLGNGKVTANGDRGSAEMTFDTYKAGDSSTGASESFTYGVIPQKLTYTDNSTTGTIGLRITTPDGNQYVVKDLSKCTATVSDTNIKNPYTAVSESSTYYTIGEWFPNYQYTYTVTVKKTGIKNITAAVVGWETVNGDIGNIDLEN